METGEYVSTEVGRCDREQKCGYHKRPRDFFDEHGGGPRKEYSFLKSEEKVFRTITIRLLPHNWPKIP